MDTVIVAGVETVAGANLAATLAEQFRIVAHSFGNEVVIHGCDSSLIPASGPSGIGEIMAGEQPKHVVYCGAAAVSSWSDDAASFAKIELSRVRQWAANTAEFGARFTFVSSDALFTGPWIFHSEHCDCRSRHAAAASIGRMETDVQRLCPSALIVRTNVFGWSPPGNAGFVTGMLESLESDSRRLRVDYVRHATPILASQLAGLTALAWKRGTTGVLHIVGAERVNPAAFVARLAERFSLPLPRIERASGQNIFGAGETSLRTDLARRTLGCGMPMLHEGFDTLFDQMSNGYCDRLNAASPVLEKAA